MDCGDAGDAEQSSSEETGVDWSGGIARAGLGFAHQRDHLHEVVRRGGERRTDAGGGGIQPRSTAGLQATARFLRVRPAGGDGFYSLGEVQIFSQNPPQLPAAVVWRRGAPIEEWLHSRLLTLALCLVAFVIVARRGMRPALDYAATGKPRLTRRHVWGILERTLGYTATALVCSALVQHVDHAWAFAIRVGLVIGVVTGIGVAIVPLIEYFADHLPERRLGAFGIVLILFGFALQSFQYWVALLDVRVT